MAAWSHAIRITIGGGHHHHHHHDENDDDDDDTAPSFLTGDDDSDFWKKKKKHRFPRIFYTKKKKNTPESKFGSFSLLSVPIKCLYENSIVIVIVSSLTHHGEGETSRRIRQETRDIIVVVSGGVAELLFLRSSFFWISIGRALKLVDTLIRYFTIFINHKIVFLILQRLDFVHELLI